MIFNLKDKTMNNYVSWVYGELLRMYGELLQKIQAAETDISINGGDISNLYGFVGFDGQLVYSLNLANEQIPEGADLNDYIMAGTYYCSGTSIATTIANSPTVYNYKLAVEFITAGFIQQTVFDRMGHKWTRCYTISSETWGGWVGGSMTNIVKLAMNSSGQLEVTSADGKVATFDFDSIIA